MDENESNLGDSLRAVNLSAFDRNCACNCEGCCHGKENDGE